MPRNLGRDLARILLDMLLPGPLARQRFMKIFL
jgi:hypothetical protein